MKIPLIVRVFLIHISEISTFADMEDSSVFQVGAGMMFPEPEISDEAAKRQHNVMKQLMGSLKTHLVKSFLGSNSLCLELC